VNVGLDTSRASHPNPSAKPETKVVFPAPIGPSRLINTGPASARPASRPIARVSSADALDRPANGNASSKLVFAIARAI
jgi:hypothetical protein